MKLEEILLLVILFVFFVIGNIMVNKEAKKIGKEEAMVQIYSLVMRGILIGFSMMCLVTIIAYSY
jgi:hypothetical protein